VITIFVLQENQDSERELSWFFNRTRIVRGGRGGEKGVGEGEREREGRDLEEQGQAGKGGGRRKKKKVYGVQYIIVLAVNVDYVCILQ
jgi:hypothetical protein